MRTVAIIPARGGSKGVPKKNIIDFLGKPLISYSIEQALSTKHEIEVYVSSDCDQILSISNKYGANPIKRPIEISGDTASSELALLHAIEIIEKEKKFDVCVFLQATSPLRTPDDIDNSLEKIRQDSLDSVFSGYILEDFLIWEKGKNHLLRSINYDFSDRKRRQDREHQYVENGSIYAFNKESFKKSKNRIHGKFGISLMSSWQNFEIDSLEDLEICEMIYCKKMRKS